MKLLTTKISLSFLITLMIFSMTFSANILRAQTMTSGSYRIQSDSVNFAGGRSTSGSYSIEDTAGETATGESQSSAFVAQAGYQQSSSTAAVSSTTTPPAEQSPVSGGASGSRGQLTNVMNFTAIPQNDSIVLSWTNPTSAIFHSVRLIRSDKFFPGNINEGDVVYEGSAEYHQDFDVAVGVINYYAIFARDVYGNYSSGALAQARITPLGEVVLVPVPTDPFIDIPVLPNVHPDITKLSLIDFDFIQSSIKIANDGTGVVIDGSENLTISLDYDKVPEILKTIAFTLIDPSDTSRVFPFLLSVNKDKTAFEAILAPLGKSGNYQMKIIVLDYKNQGLKRLEGNLRAFVFDQAKDLQVNPETYMRNIIAMIAIILVIFIALFAIYRNRKRKNEI